MTTETTEVLEALSEIMNINLFDEEEVLYNSCGIMNLFYTKEKAQANCDTWNKFAKFMGWEEMKVYHSEDDEAFVCSKKEEAKEYNYTEV